MDNTPTSKLIRNVFLAFAEFERDIIIEWTSEGKAIAKQNANYREGRPKKYKRQQIEYALELLETNSYKQVVNAIFHKLYRKSELVEIRIYVDSI